MTIFLNLLLLAVGFVMLAKGADFFVDGAASIAKKLKIPQLVIGLTIVAMGTSAPEAAVSISAAFQGSAEITIGNIVGSNILNILIILGLSALIIPLRVAQSSIRFDLPVLFGATVVLLLCGLDGTIKWYEGLIFLVIFVAYLIFLFKTVKEDPDQAGGEIKEMPVFKSILFAILGLVSIILGSNFSVDAATALAKEFGMSERFIGLTIVALGTSLPELFTSVSAVMKGNDDIAVGNILGSNIFNILFIVGLSSILIPVPFDAGFLVDTIISLGAALIILLCCIKDNKLQRWSGALMLSGYAMYFVYLLMQ